MRELTFIKLVQAYKDCRRHKRNTRAALEFEMDLENSLITLYNELLENTYKISGGICFIVIEPKIREVWAASFRDRIVHHLVCNEIAADFYKRFIPDTFSCIPERGTLNAIKKFQKYAISSSQNYTKKMYYLKADIKNFFVSIDKAILFKEIKKLVKEEWILNLLQMIIYHDPRRDVEIRSPQWKFNRLPKYKSLWHTINDRGLPIGNLTSQFFSNVYLNIFDQYVKHYWRAKYYCRYVDDFIILDENPKKLNAIHKDLARFLSERLKLELHKTKKSINYLTRGVDFVGYNLKPNRVLLRQKTIKKMFRRVNEYERSKKRYTKEEMEALVRSINSYLGFLRASSGYKLRKKLCEKCASLFIACDSEYTKIWLR